jgi:HK97 family phage portal protein
MTPTILDKVLERAGLVRKSAIDQAASSSVALLGTKLSGMNAQQALNFFNGWTYACIRAIAEEIANMELELYRVGKKEDTRVWEHELLDTLEGVNESQTGYELRYLLASYMEAAGNSYWFLEGVKKPGDKPTAIYPLNSGKVTVEIEKDTFPSKITGYRYNDHGKNYRFTPAQILHLRYPNPNNNHVGLGTVQAIANWIEADEFATEFNKKYFENGAKLGIVIETEATNTAQIEVLRKSIQALHKGMDNVYREVILPKGAKLGQSPDAGVKDMDFANLMEKMQNKILAGFRVPRSILGITDDVNRANAEATHYIFIARTIVPKMKQIVSLLNEFYVPLYGDDLYLSFKNPVPEDRAALMEEMSKATGNQPIMSINEARERYFGMDPIDGGDDVMGSGLMTPVGTLKPQTESMNEQRTRAAKKGKPSSKGAKAAKARKNIAGSLAELATKEIQKNEKQITEALETKGVEDLTNEEFEPIYKAARARITRYEKLLKEKVQDHNAKMFKEVKDNLGDLGEKPTDAQLMDKAKNKAALIKTATPIYLDLWEKESEEAARLIGKDKNATATKELTPEMKKALQKSIELMAESYTETTLAALKEKLGAALAEGASLDQLIDVVQGIAEFSDEIRAETVARTETFRTANTAAKETWKQSGVVNEIKWYTARDELVCPYCGPMDGKTVGIEENFFNKGDTVEGEDGSTMAVEYADVEAGALHVNCRCYTRPVKLTN